MTRSDYRAMLALQGPVWCFYTLLNDYPRLPCWALVDLLHYSGKG